MKYILGENAPSKTHCYLMENQQYLNTNMKLEALLFRAAVYSQSKATFVMPILIKTLINIPQAEIIVKNDFGNI